MTTKPIITFSHPKGGVAKTTSAAALAGALTEQGLRVLAVDMDPQGSLTLALGHLPQNVPFSLGDFLQYRRGLTDVALPTKVEGLDLIPANPQLYVVQQGLKEQNGYTTFRSLLRMWLPQISYDVLIVDTPPGQGFLTLNGLIAATQVLIPTQPEYFSAYSLRYLLQTIRWIRLRFNPDLIYRVFITMYQRRQRAHAWIRARLEATFGPGLCRTVIPLEAKVREAAIAGLPITHYAPSSQAAKAYRELAKEVFFYEREAETAGRTAGTASSASTSR